MIILGGLLVESLPESAVNQQIPDQIWTDAIFNSESPKSYLIIPVII